MTLGDIASEAGVSRPTVYQAFANKEEIFTALIEIYHEDALERIAQVRQSSQPTRAKIEAAIEIWVIEPFEMLLASPGAKELLDCTFGFAAKATDAGYAAFEDEVVAILDDGDFSGRLPTRDLAHLMVVSMRGFKGQVEEVEALRRLIRQLLELALG